MTSPPNNRTFI